MQFCRGKRISQNENLSRANCEEFKAAISSSRIMGSGFGEEAAGDIGAKIEG
jgi:hypothetical protein